MFVRLREARRLSAEKFRVTLDVVDPDRRVWDLGDCVVQMDLVDGPGKHISCPRGLLEPAFDLYRLAPGERPTSTEARLLWEMARAVDRYVERLFDAGVLCPFDGEAKDRPAERSDDTPS